MRQTDGFQLSPELVEGRPGYLLRVATSAWKIIPQQELGSKQGIALLSRPDFILKPLRPSKGLPIAVFLDGFAYHADSSLDNNRIASDLAKRNAIRQSGKYHVWSLTWADLKDSVAPGQSLLSTLGANLSPILGQLTPELFHFPCFSQAKWSSWNLLLTYLQHLAKSDDPEPSRQWRVAASIVASNSTQRVPTDALGLEQALDRLILGHSPQVSGCTSSTYSASISECGPYRLLASIPIASLQIKSTEGALGALWFDDVGHKPSAEFQEEWQELLRMSNLFQFVPRFLVITQRMIEQGMIANYTSWLLESDNDHEAAQPSSSLNEAQRAELLLLHPLLQETMHSLLVDGRIPWPEFGYEFTDAHGRCGTSILEIAWPFRKVGIVLPDQQSSEFANDGWNVLQATDLNSATLKQTLTTPHTAP